jgi:hypothetical protein
VRGTVYVVENTVPGMAMVVNGNGRVHSQ